MKTQTYELSRALVLTGQTLDSGILSFVHMSVTSSEAVLTSTNYSTTTIVRIPCESDVERSAVLPHALLAQPLAGLSPNDTVTLDIHPNDSATLKAGRRKASIPCRPLIEWPDLRAPSESNPVSIEASMLLEMLSVTRLAMSTDETRMNLNGVRLESSDGVLRAAATDGHRLHIIERPFETERVETIIHRDSVKAFCNALKGVSGPVQLGLTANTVTLNIGNVTIIGRAIEDSYPDFKRVTPAPRTRGIRTDASALAKAVKYASQVLGPRYAGVMLSVSDSITISAKGLSGEVLEESLSGTAEGVSLVLGMNWRYAQDMCACLSGEFLLEIDDEFSPLVARQNGITAVLMPMKV